MLETDLLRKRLYFQSTHRGTKENDLMLTRYADACLSCMTLQQMQNYDDFLCEQDGDIYRWLAVGVDDYPQKYQDLIADIRAVLLSTDKRHAV